MDPNCLSLLDRQPQGVTLPFPPVPKADGSRAISLGLAPLQRSHFVATCKSETRSFCPFRSRLRGVGLRKSLINYRDDFRTRIRAPATRIVQIRAVVLAVSFSLPRWASLLYSMRGVSTSSAWAAASPSTLHTLSACTLRTAGSLRPSPCVHRGRTRGASHSRRGRSPGWLHGRRDAHTCAACDALQRSLELHSGRACGSHRATSRTSSSRRVVKE